MKVTSLDVSNLLSFEGFHLDFDDRLTVLVGPNGAGKTNIVRVLDLVTKLVDWADERSRSGAAPPTPADAMLSSYVQAMHDGSVPGTPMEIRLGVQFTTPPERTRVVEFVRAALLATLSDESQAGDEDRKAQLAAWVTAEVREETLLPLFTGTLTFRHPGYDKALWEARYEFEMDGSLYDWVLFTPSYWASIVAHGAAVGPTTPEAKLSEVLLGLPAHSSPPAPLPDPIPSFALGALLPSADKRLTNIVVRLGTGAVNDQHEPFRTAAGLLGFSLNASGGQQAFGLARALRLNMTDGLVILGEQFRGLGVGGAIPWKAGVYPWEMLTRPVPPRDPGFLPLRLFLLKNGNTREERRTFELVRDQFRRLAAGRGFDVTFAAAPISVTVPTPVGAGQVAIPARAAQQEDSGEPGSIITVVAWDEGGAEANSHERPIQLFGAGTWEALVLAEALVSARGRFTVLDEPGTSFHPTWQGALRQAFREAGGQVVVVTHSPQLVPVDQGGDLVRFVRMSNEGEGSSPHRFQQVLEEEDLSRIARVFALSADARSLLFARAAVLVEGETELGALPLWFAKAAQASYLRSPSDLQLAIYSVGGENSFRPVVTFLDGFRIPWSVVCDGGALRPDKGKNHVFHQIESTDTRSEELIDFLISELDAGKEFSFEYVRGLARRHGVFTLALGWERGRNDTRCDPQNQGGKKEGNESFEAFLREVCTAEQLAEAKERFPKSKVQRGMWIGQNVACPEEVKGLYRDIVNYLGLADDAACKSSNVTGQS
jgi:predicted ATPase